MTRGIRLLWSSPRTRDTHTCCRVFASGAVTTCFYDLGLSRGDLNTQPSACEANALAHCATAAVSREELLCIFQPRSDFVFTSVTILFFKGRTVLQPRTTFVSISVTILFFKGRIVAPLPTKIIFCFYISNHTILQGI